MTESLLDTDILNEVLQQRNADVVAKGVQYLQEHGRFSFSVVTWYEVIRGLKFKQATRQ